MSGAPHKLRFLHRALAGLIPTTAVALLTLRHIGVIDAGLSMRLFGFVEVTLAATFAMVTILRFSGLRNSTGVPTRGFLEAAEAEEPPLRLLVKELRTFQSLGYFLRGKLRAAEGAMPFGYTKGTLAFPLAIVILCLIELTAVHLVVPWIWFQLALAAITLWGILFVCGYLASRAVHPHTVADGILTLRWGVQTVLMTPTSQVLEATEHMDHRYAHPRVEDRVLILTQFQSANVRVRFTSPVRASLTGLGKKQPSEFSSLEVRLYVDHPRAFVATLTQSWGEVLHEHP